MLSDDGACAYLWFSDRPYELGQAKAYCHDCPLRSLCLAGAMERAEPWGVWGGEIFQDGVIIARKRSRGRPPKRRTATPSGYGDDLEGAVA